MAKRYSKQWKKNVGEGVKRSKKTQSPATRKKLSEAARMGNFGRIYKRKDLEELKSFARIRERLFEERGRKCEECGWEEKNPFTGIIPVQVNHKDHNRKNNKRDNLKILCPNCHSMTEYFMFYGNTHKNKNANKRRYTNV